MSCGSRFPELLPKDVGDAVKQMPPTWGISAGCTSSGLHLGARREQVETESSRCRAGIWPERMGLTRRGLSQCAAHGFPPVLPPLTPSPQRDQDSWSRCDRLLELTGRARASRNSASGVRSVVGATVIYSSRTDSRAGMRCSSARCAFRAHRLETTARRDTDIHGYDSRHRALVLVPIPQGMTSP